jgi:Fe-S cluster biogenesis protein NfuA
LIRADQGDLYLVEAQETYVSLHLGGRFSGCPGNTLVARRVIQPALAAVVPNARVQVTSGFVIPDGAELLEDPKA